MKKRVLKAFVTTVSSIVLALSSISAPAIAANSITLTKAKQIALTDSKLSEKDVIFIKTQLSKVGAQDEYEIEFYRGTTAYSYEIDSKTGAILHSEIDPEYYVNPGARPSL